jgi:hypothetical protein
VHDVLTYPPLWYLMRATGIVSLLLLTSSSRSESRRRGVVGASVMWRLGGSEEPAPQRQAVRVSQSLVTSPRRVSRS